LPLPRALISVRIFLPRRAGGRGRDRQIDDVKADLAPVRFPVQRRQEDRIAKYRMGNSTAPPRVITVARGNGKSGSRCHWVIIQSLENCETALLASLLCGCQVPAVCSAAAHRNGSHPFDRHQPGVYQIGEVQARSCTVAATPSCSGRPARTAS
jgi:hypothetical protein